MPARPFHHPTARGFTLVEAVVSIVIVGVMFVAALSTVASAAKGRLIQAEWRRADALGRALLAEVTSSGYGSTSGHLLSSVLLALGNLGQGADRSAWTTIDDFHGLTDAPVSDRFGRPLSDLPTGWRRTVAVERVDPASPAGASTGGTDLGLKRITVTVTAPSGKKTVLTSLRSRWSWTQADPDPGARRLQGATLSLRVRGGIEVHGGALLAGSDGSGTIVTSP